MIRIIKTKKTFDPFMVGIEINSLEDAQALYAIFNHISITNFLTENSGIKDDNMREVLLTGIKEQHDMTVLDKKLHQHIEKFQARQRPNVTVREKLV